MSATITVPYHDARTGRWEGVVSEPTEPSPAELRALLWSRRALGNAWGRCGNSRGDALTAWTAAVEGVWWALALDEQLSETPGKQYEEARKQDDHGKIVGGMRWLRNRHAHEIFVTGAGGAKKPAFGNPGSVIVISPSNRWMTSAQINPKRERKGPAAVELRQEYDEHVAEQGLEQSLYAASIWFDRVFSACGFPDFMPPEDPTIL